MSLGTVPVFAIGPEGGWTDQEVALLEAQGFVRHSLGPRILKTETATIALLSRFMDAWTTPEITWATSEKSC